MNKLNNIIDQLVKYSGCLFEIDLIIIYRCQDYQ